MIFPALYFGDKVRAAFSKKILEDASMFYYFDNFVSYSFEIDMNESKKLQYVSVYQGNVIGYAEAKVDRVNSVVEQLLVIRFDEKVHVTVILDFFAFLKLIFVKRNFRKMVYHVIDGNPSMSMYQKHLVERLQIAKKIGTIHQYKKLRDNNYYDMSLFEIDREDFIKCIDKHPELFRNPK